MTPPRSPARTASTSGAPGRHHPQRVLAEPVDHLPDPARVGVDHDRRGRQLDQQPRPVRAAARRPGLRRPSGPARPGPPARRPAAGRRPPAGTAPAGRRSAGPGGRPRPAWWRRPSARRRRSTTPSASASAYPRMVDSGVRSSCETDSRNSRSRPSLVCNAAPSWLSAVGQLGGLGRAGGRRGAPSGPRRRAGRRRRAACRIGRAMKRASSAPGQRRRRAGPASSAIQTPPRTRPAVPEAAGRVSTTPLLVPGSGRPTISDGRPSDRRRGCRPAAPAAHLGDHPGGQAGPVDHAAADQVDARCRPGAQLARRCARGRPGVRRRAARRRGRDFSTSSARACVVGRADRDRQRDQRGDDHGDHRGGRGDQHDPAGQGAEEVRHRRCSRPRARCGSRPAAAPSLARTWATCTSTVRVPACDAYPQTPASSSSRVKTRPGRPSRCPSRSNSVGVRVSGAPSTVTRRRAGSSSSGPSVADPAAVRRPGGPAQQRPDPGDQLARAERLGHVVVAAQLQAEDPVDLVVAGGEEDDRRPVAVLRAAAGRSRCPPGRAARCPGCRRPAAAGGRRPARRSRRARRARRSRPGSGRAGRGRRSGRSSSTTRTRPLPVSVTRPSCPRAGPVSVRATVRAARRVR